MKTLEQTTAADLRWLATLLTANPETAASVTAEATAGDDNRFFSGWMRAWSRRVVIAKSLARVRSELAASICRLTLCEDRIPAAPPHHWALDQSTSRLDLQRALLAIDVFPRAAVLLLLFEGVPLADAAVLLDVEPELVRKGQVAGVVELTMNLARLQRRPEQLVGRFQHA
jgi:DNA-directed RNA polymerase specialized sigma24 family protein